MDTTMKKGLLGMVLLSLSALGAFAQGRRAKLESSMHVKGGLNIANITISNDGDISKANSFNSWHAGFNYDLPLSEAASFQFGLTFTGKGSKTELGKPGDALYSKATTNPFYVELPVSFVGKIEVTKGMKIFIGAGPYGAIGVTGRNKIETTSSVGTIYSNKDIDFANDDPTTTQEEGAGYGKMKRFDYGVNGLAGIEFKRFTLGANYGYGLAKVVSGTDNNSNDKFKNRVLSFSFGIKL
jgi:hypothetical protein